MSTAGRSLGHAAVLGLALLVILIGRAVVDAGPLASPDADLTPVVVLPADDAGDLSYLPLAAPPASSRDAGQPSELPPPSAPTTPLPAPEAPAKLLRYRVAAGDTVFDLAAKFDVSPETIIWANKLEDAPDELKIGQQLVFPSVSGVVHETLPGDTVAGIAQRYLADSAAIVAANALDPDLPLRPGRQLIVPGGRLASRQASSKPAASRVVPLMAPLPAQAAIPSVSDSQPLIGDEYGAAEEASSRSGSRAPATRVEISYAVDRNPDHWAFVQAAVEPAQASQAATGVPASVTIGQAIHESAWGASRLSREGNNYFGIKAEHKPGPAGVIYLNTAENIEGSDVVVEAAFRAYHDMTESFLDHGLFFVENSRYARAMANTDNPRAFLRLISEAGYATDPAYVAKVQAYMDRFDLYQYDR